MVHFPYRSRGVDTDQVPSSILKLTFANIVATAAFSLLRTKAKDRPSAVVPRNHPPDPVGSLWKQPRQVLPVPMPAIHHGWTL